MINDLLFYDLSNAKGKYYETLLQSGISYQYQPLNPYLCADFGHDAGLILSSYYVQNSLIKDPLFKLIEVDSDVFTKLKEFEDEIVSSTTFLDAKVVDMFIDEIQILFDTHTITTLIHLLGKENVNQLYSLTTLWSGKSAWVEHLIGNIDDMALSTINVSRQQKIPPHALFLTRSYISTVFFLSNETIVNAPLLLTEKIENVPLKEFNLRGYNNDLLSEIPIQDISKFMSDSGLKVSLIMTLELFNDGFKHQYVDNFLF